MPEELWVNVLGSYGKEMLTCGTAPEMLYQSLQATLLTYLLHPAQFFRSLPASYEIPHIWWNPEFHYGVYKSLPTVPTISQINPVHAPPTLSNPSRCILLLHLHLCLALPSGLLPSRFPTEILIHFPSLPHTCSMPRPFDSS